MKILIAGALDPHENHDEKCLCEAISDWYTKNGHTTDICYLPFKMDYHGIHEQILAYRLITTYPESEMLITVGYPAFALKHPRKHVMLLNFLPEFHVNYNTEYGYMEQWYRIPKDQKMRQNLFHIENICLNEAESINCASTFLCDEVNSLGCRSGIFENINSLTEKDSCETTPHEYIIQSCLAPMDRLDLLLETIKNTKVKLRIFIPSAEECYIKAVKTRAARFSMSDRVHISQTEIGINDLKVCRGVVCLRRGSDYVPSWYGKAVESQIPTITLTDCGALCELYQSEYTTIVEPKADVIANAFLKHKSKKKLQVSARNELSPETITLLERWVR